MSFITRLALSRSPITILGIIVVFALGIYAYNNLQRELFPPIELPNIFITAYYQNADPEKVMREVTIPIEEAIDGMSGLQQFQSTSQNNFSSIVATYDFDQDMKEIQSDIESEINGISLPDDVNVFVNRINTDEFPQMQITVSGSDDIPTLQRAVEDHITSRLRQVPGVATVDIAGQVEEQVIIFADADKVHELGLSMFAVSDAVAAYNTTVPASSITTNGVSYPVYTTNKLGSVQELRDLVIGFEQTDQPSLPPDGGKRPITLGDVAEIELTTPNGGIIARANGKPALSVILTKEADANTVTVTDAALVVLNDIVASGVLPPNMEIQELSNDGPYVREALDNLLREGTTGFIFAIIVVFAFLLNIRPSILLGIRMALRPTAIMAVSIPLSIITGVLLMSLTDITLNFMSLAGLAIAVGRVVDDSIVVLENMYRHIEEGEERIDAAYTATREVAAAIVSSTLTTVAVFLPLAFIPGIVGEFFSPFAVSVSLALLASTAVAVTAVPVLGAILLRPGEFSDINLNAAQNTDALIQRIYTPILLWALRRKFITIAGAILITVASLGLLRVIPITFFPASTPEYLTIDIELPIGASIERTNAEALAVENVLSHFVETGDIIVSRTILGSRADEFGFEATGTSHIAGIYIRLSEDVHPDITEIIRQAIPEKEDVSVTVQGISGGPPSDQLEINIIGNNFTQIADISRRLEDELSTIDGVVNLDNSVSSGADEVVIRVDPVRAGEYSLTTDAVGRQVSQFTSGREIAEMDIEGDTYDIVLRGKREDADNINKLQNLNIESPFGQVKLGAIADIGIEQGPVSISRFDNYRSASITGLITAENTQAVSVQVDAAIARLDVPPSVEVRVGGIFDQINEGFQDIFLAMAIGIVLVYLVMVATLGSLRTPFVIVLSLPLCIVGALLALLITGRTLSLSALMGFLLLIGVVVTNAIVLLVFVEQLRARGYGAYEALVEGGRVRLRPILMTAFTTTFALAPLAASSYDGGIIGAELATIVIGGLVSSTFLTLLVVPATYLIFTVSIPGLFNRLFRRSRPQPGGATGAPDIG